jgi:uncharacterized protein YdhG (YjbR/CyaY superfamily)
VPATRTSTKRLADAKKANIWSDEERAAMQASATERKAHAKLTPAEERAAGEAEVREKLNGMPADDRRMGERIYDLVTNAEASLMPKTYYGMPAWAKDGKVICFYKPKSKFKVRYSTFEFQPDARLDDGELWAVSFAVKELTPSAEAKITALVKKAAS